jgi:hypothetical protein
VGDMKKIFKRIIITIILSPFIALFLYFGLNYIGFCFEQCKFLSDEEKIDKAIKLTLYYVYRSIHYDVDNTLIPNPQLDIPYLKPEKDTDRDNMYIVTDKEVEDFKANNPNCCSLSKRYYKKNGEYFEISFWNRAFGWASDFVIVNFKYKDINGEEKMREMLFPITNCGEMRLSFNEAIF